MGEWLDRLHRKYGEQPPKDIVDTAYEKLAAALQAAERVEIEARRLVVDSSGSTS
jgi:uncharacterized damage-inducible protein DinB